MKLKINRIMMLALVFIMMLSTSAYAFEDIKGDPAEASIMKLKEAGIVSGEDAKHYNPQGKVSFAQGVSLITKGMDLNINHIKFVKAPMASDYFSSVPNDAWYASAFINAHLNGLPIDRDVDPNQAMTREQFANLLKHAIDEKGSYPLIQIYLEIADMDEVQQDYAASVQAITILKIAQLDDKQKFYPKEAITRGQVAGWVDAAREFVGKMKPIIVSGERPEYTKDITMKIEKESSNVNKVTITWHDRPNSGYGIVIKGIEFTSKNEAIITYDLQFPTKGSNYLTVISNPTAITYISNQYTPVLNP
ncbi:S-layer homology domain-containing protein [Paenibacillus albiflavus]|uniref:S-layer homology domain-containing protein n=1 Tax=Paenibacillus albiflavus TaxID=2545760 RepID=A0A4R4EL84_9BACL|nr:S-layer homology domain-containing protein [Paenibacillus albiflavus]TCZ80100.1 S-layer homology domain-containing protein [Paenibacillus albiflavus]